jgi:transglutaminase-like putative cysteine protease
MVKGLLVLCVIILVFILLPKLVRFLGIKNENEFKQSLGEIAYNEVEDLKDSLGLTSKYQRLANSIIKEAEDKFGIDISKYKTENEFQNPNITKKNYSRTVLTDDENHPFQITKELAELTDSITANSKNELDKLKKIFNWFVNNINYGTAKREINNGYRTSNEVFKDKEGICGEMASLFVVMSRHIGIKSNYVSIRKDLYGENVYHACSGVSINNETILIDPAYNKFDANHKDFIIRTDIDAIKHLKHWRKI